MSYSNVIIGTFSTKCPTLSPDFIRMTLHWLSLSQASWFYTGDIARMDEDGFIWITDRKKDVVITGGENIYPVEIEDVLRSHPKIYDAAVIGFPDERLGEIAVAIIDPKPRMTLTEKEVLDFCIDQLSHFKHPRKIFFNKVPRNPTGKIEKPKLREKFRQ